MGPVAGKTNRTAPLPLLNIKEDLHGTNPKFVVSDRDGVNWKVKFGVEACPESVATRLVGAVGFYANEDYFVSDLRVQKMPRHLHRGQNMVAPDGSMRNVSLKREGLKKLGERKWCEDPFVGTREWNGLRVLMALLNKLGRQRREQLGVPQRQIGSDIHGERSRGAFRHSRLMLAPLQGKRKPELLPAF
jgi:hypothetical protein